MKKQKMLSIIALILVGGMVLIIGSACSSIDQAGKSASGGCGMAIGNCVGCVAGSACTACVGCMNGCGEVIQEASEAQVEKNR